MRRVEVLKNWMMISLVLLLVVLCSACGESKTNPKASEAPEISAPQPVTQDASPSPPRVKTHPVTTGTRETYQWYCAQCHGIKGKGNGINAPHTAVPPRDHTKAEYLETRSDEQLFHVIKFGGLAGGRAPCMPRWGHTLNDDTIHALVNYIRELCECDYL